MVARSRTRPLTLTSSTCSRTRSQPRSLLSIARLNKARLRARRSTWSRTRIDHTSLGFRGRFCPIRRPLFQGSRRGTDGRLLSSMIVSSEPTAPSRLRSGEDRRGILSPVVGWLWKPTRGSRPPEGPHRSDRTLPVADGDHDCPPPLQTLSGRGSLRSLLTAASWCRSFGDDAAHEEGLKLACLALASRAGEVSDRPPAAAQPEQRELVFMPAITKPSCTGRRPCRRALTDRVVDVTPTLDRFDVSI